ncbi:MAG: RDD family protein [Bifidobacteriaceae bacterium]|jgi:uncharacterized RDD family membrane protein YckC|nr:RDD family protein [Bifidobacteriaceae bacterium]
MRGDEIVVGEAVKLELRPASFAARLLALLLDFAIMLVETFILLEIIGAAGLAEWSQAAQTAAFSVVAAVVLLVAPTTVETLTRGLSAGKRAAGLRVVRDDGGPVKLRQALTRALLAVFEVWALMGIPAFAAMLFNDRGKRVGDFLAGTYVMRARGARIQVFSLPMPPELASWARLADIGRLGDGVALRARQFLLRAGSLTPQSRAQLGAALAAEVARGVAPPPPAGAHPERFLAAVVCERRDREMAAAPARAARSQALTGAVRRLPYQIPDPAS